MAAWLARDAAKSARMAGLRPAEVSLPIVPSRDLPSRALYQGRDRAAARSFLYAIGLKAEDIDKPFIGVSNVWTETMPCNFGLRAFAVPRKPGTKAAAANPMKLN